jgi:hypothetical protein
LADISDLSLWERLGQCLCCSLPIISIIRGIVGIVAGANSRPVWEASFTPSSFCLPSLKTDCLPIVQHPCDLPSTRCLLPVIGIIWALLALLLAEICDLFWMLLLCHHASAHLPSNPFIY